jgi:hypothetical protein
VGEWGSEREGKYLCLANPMAPGCWMLTTCLSEGQPSRRNLRKVVRAECARIWGDNYPPVQSNGREQNQDAMREKILESLAEIGCCSSAQRQFSQ